MATGGFRPAIRANFGRIQRCARTKDTAKPAPAHSNESRPGAAPSWTFYKSGEEHVYARRWMSIQLTDADIIPRIAALVGGGTR